MVNYTVYLYVGRDINEDVSKYPKGKNELVIGYDTINDFTFSIVCNKAGMAYYSTYSSAGNNAVLAPVIDENGFVKCSTIKGNK